MTERRFHSEYLSLAETLYRIAFYILESADEAEDAVQDVYLKLWESRDSLDGIREPKAYCIRMLKNLCLDRIRHASHSVSPASLPEDGPQMAQSDEIDARCRLDKVLEAIKSLPERQRQVLLMRTVEGLSYEEMSARTGMNNATLRVTLSQARTKLKSII